MRLPSSSHAWHRDLPHVVATSPEGRSSPWFGWMPACSDRQDSPLGADHFVLLKAPAHSVNEIVERPALALGFPHDELCRVQFHHVELQPLATRRKLNSQACVFGDEPKMLW